MEEKIIEVSLSNAYVCTRGLHTRRFKTAVGGLAVLMLVTVLMYTPATHTAFTYTHTPLSGEVASGGGGAGQDAGVEGSQLALSCLPAKHVFFLKTHKCASSTVQNILFRYGYLRNLTFALPSSGNYLGNPQHFKASMIPKNLLPKSGVVDIFAVHSRLNPKENSRVLHPDASWVTVVRDPVSLYESLFNFYHMAGYYGFGLKDFGNKTSEELAQLPRAGNKLGRNQMLFDFGYSPDLGVADLRRALADLDSRFDLVMIAERMDESLILLRHLLCWNLSDVVVFTKNARRSEVKPGLAAKTVAAIRELNSADFLLYEHFLAKHREAVYAFGEDRMRAEVAALRVLRDEVYEECGVREVKGRDRTLVFKEYSQLVSSYVASNMNDTTCLLLSLPELALVQLARDKQEEMIKEGTLKSKKVIAAPKPPAPPPLGNT